MTAGVLILLGAIVLGAVAAIGGGLLELLALARIRKKGVRAVAVCRGHVWGPGKTFHLQFTDTGGARHSIWTTNPCVEGHEYEVLYNASRPSSWALAPVRLWDPSRPRQVGMLLGSAGVVVLAAIVLVME
ncbi:hypothetical protein [Streptomyces sp. NPDC057552]|uniref:hypothetical protein n=1 Tax=Streptomyces sp. NPDC057552 TaxID=3350537 RepID=UPI00367DE28E